MALIGWRAKRYAPAAWTMLRQTLQQLSIREDWPVWQRHGRIRAFASKLGLMVPQLNAQIETAAFPRTIRWARLSMTRCRSAQSVLRRRRKVLALRCWEVTQFDAARQSDVQRLISA